MENQHRKISGYRELSPAEIELMNKIKALGPQLESVIGDVKAHLRAQYMASRGGVDGEPSSESVRLMDAEPDRWVSIARTNLQQGLMALTRAVAQPTFF